MVREADRGFLAVQGSVSDSGYYRSRAGQGIIGIDVRNKTFASSSTGEKIIGPNAHRRVWSRLKMQQRAIARQMQAAKQFIGLGPGDLLPKGRRLPRSQNWDKAKISVAPALSVAQVLVGHSGG